MRKIEIYLAIILVLVITGCATYRTNSDLDFDSTNVGQIDPDFQILEGDLDNTSYTVISPIEAIVKKLTVFHKNPTKEQVDLVLFQKAAEIGANAVIKVKYKSGVGFDTWGFMQANGTAVRIETESPKEIIDTDADQADIQFMGFAAEEISSKNYDKVLWIKALSLAEGDKEKQKGIYIKLRSSQLASQSKVLKTKPNDSPDAAINISGLYVSQITSTNSKYFKKKYRKLVIMLKQEGNNITGSNSTYNVEIWGTRVGDTISFDITAHLMNNFQPIRGKWEVNADGTGLKGTWKIPDKEASGQWNLTKIK